MKKQYVNKILIFISLVILALSVILNKNFGDLDELWNYNFARNISDGLVAYRDFNIIVTPLSAMIASIFIYFFGNELVTMRILAAILISIILLLGYLILENKKIPKWLNIVTMTISFFIIKKYIAYDYNYGILAVGLFICYLELKNYDKTKEILEQNILTNIFIGILLGVGILLKQTIGIVLACCVIGYPIFEIRKKEQIKKFLNKAIIRIIGMLIPLIIFIIYLIVNNAMKDFINYCILGVKTFDNKIEYKNLICSSNKILKFASVGLPTIWIIGIIKSLKKKDVKLQIISCIALPLMLIVYPISDEIHFYIAMYMNWLITIIIIYEIIAKIKNKIGITMAVQEKNKNAKTLIYIYCTSLVKKAIEVIFIILAIYSIKDIMVYQNKMKANPNVNHYAGIPLTIETKDNIEKIDNYIKIQNSDIYILDSEASVYMIPINRYNKDFDMFQKGNFGEAGEEGQIKKLQEMKNNTKILIKNKKITLNWQNPDKVTNYIRKTLHKIEEIGIYDVYQVEF
ncbi:MAG: phospholipid carrier-dependent glycosyltransferase [Clostridia bacterium]